MSVSLVQVRFSNIFVVVPFVRSRSIYLSFSVRIQYYRIFDATFILNKRSRSNKYTYLLTYKLQRFYLCYLSMVIGGVLH